MLLKPQDTLLALKYWSQRQLSQSGSVRDIAELIGISASEVSKGTKRLILAHLAVERDGAIFAESGALFEWLSYGVRYAYPLETVGYGRGMATAWNCPIVKSEMVPPSPAWVWSIAGGDSDGILIKPIHDSVPKAAGNDGKLYQALSLVEVIRGGKPRELKIARKLLSELIQGRNE